MAPRVCAYRKYKEKSIIRPLDSNTMDGWFLSHHERGKKIEMTEHMLDYVIALLEDANDFSWSATKASHAVLLCRKEQEEVSDFSDIQKLTGSDV